jgi:hypothetical protein
MCRKRKTHRRGDVRRKRKKYVKRGRREGA